MSDLVDVLVSRLEPAFDRAADPARARSSSAYMRDQFPFYGIVAPIQREIARDVTSGLPAPTETQLKRLANVCWKRPQREWQYFACGYLRRNIGAASPRFLGTLGKLVSTRSWWDTVDSLASRSVGPMVRQYPELVTTMDEWIDSENIWIARTAILHQLTYRQHTDVDRLFAYCLRRSSDTEFFIRKAIGWALREYTKTDTPGVRAFLRDHGRELSGLSQREALKWLERRGAIPRRSKP